MKSKLKEMRLTRAETGRDVEKSEASSNAKETTQAAAAGIGKPIKQEGREGSLDFANKL